MGVLELQSVEKECKIQPPYTEMESWELITYVLAILSSTLPVVTPQAFFPTFERLFCSQAACGIAACAGFFTDACLCCPQALQFKIQ